jgi:hypothetical protein
MSDDIQEHAEHIQHAGHTLSPAAKQAAIAIAIMAAALALTEFSAKSAQVATLTAHVSASDTWSQYQGKSTRRTVYEQTAAVLASQPNATDPDVQKRIAAAQAGAARMRSEPGADGMEQLAEQAKELEHERDHQLHRTHGLETGSGGLQIAIVLVSVSVVTGARMLLFGGIAVAALATVYAVLAGLSLV